MRSARIAPAARSAAPLRVGGARGHAVDGDSAVGVLPRKQLGGGRDGRAQDDRDGEVGLGLPHGGRGHEDDPAEAARGHGGHRQARQAQWAEQQQFGAGPPRVVADVEDPAGRRAAGVEDQHVRRAIPRGHRVHRRRRVRRSDVADQGADDADQHHRQPVDAGDVLSRPELGDEHGDQDRPHDVGGVGETEAEVFVDVVGEGLPHRRAEDLDHPEVDGDLRDLVEHAAPVAGCRRTGECLRWVHGGHCEAR